MISLTNLLVDTDNKIIYPAVNRDDIPRGVNPRLDSVMHGEISGCQRLNYVRRRLGNCVYEIDESQDRDTVLKILEEILPNPNEINKLQDWLR
jgi:hypothetical protein